MPPPTTTRPPTPAPTPQTGLGKAVDAAKKAAGQGRRRPPTADDRDRHRDDVRADVKPEPAAIAASRPRRSPSFRRTSPARSRRARCSCSACFADGRQAVAPDGRRRPLRPQRPQAGQPLRRRGRSSSTSRSQALRPTARWSTTSASTRRPSVVVIDRDLKGTVLTGYVDRIAINQAIADARRDSIDAEHHGRVPARGQRDLRATSSMRVDALVARRRSAASKAARRRPTTRLLAIVASYRREVAAPRRRRPSGAACKTRVAEGPQGRRAPTLAACVKAAKTEQRPPTSAAPTALSTARTTATALDRRFNEAGAHRLRESTAGRRLERSWTASASPNTSPRPTGAARAFRGLRRPRRRRALRRPDPRLGARRGRPRGRGRLRRRRAAAR